MSHLRSLVDAARVAEGLAEAGLRPLEAGPLRLERAWLAPGGMGLTALFAERDAGCSAAWGVHPLEVALESPSWRRALLARRAGLLPGLGAVAAAALDDPKLPALRRALDPATARRRLRPWLSRRAREGELEARLLRYKPMARAVVEFRPRDGEAQAGTLIGKILRRPASAACRAFLSAREAAPESVAPPLPETCGWVDSWEMWVTRRWPGRPLTASLDGPEANVLLEACGRALAGLHRSRLPLDRRHGPDRDLATVGEWVRVTASAFPERSRVLWTALAALWQASGRRARGELVPSHRDFHDGQVLTGERGLVLLDVETATLAERELDVGNFLAQLRLRALQLPLIRATDLADAFLRGYIAASNRVPEEEALRWYEASACLRLACVHAFRPGEPGGAATLAEEALALLDRAGDEAGHREDHAPTRAILVT